MTEALQPPTGNYELQAEFLELKQRGISAELFETGVVSRLVGAVEIGGGAKTDVSGLAQLDKRFVPSLGKIKTRGPYRDGAVTGCYYIRQVHIL